MVVSVLTHEKKQLQGQTVKDKACHHITANVVYVYNNNAHVV